MGSHPMTDDFAIRGKTDTDTWDVRPCEDGGRNGSDTSVSERTPEIAGNHQKLEGARRALLWRVWRERGPADQTSGPQSCERISLLV